MIYIAKEISASTADKESSPSSTTFAKNGYCYIQGSNAWWYRTFLKYDLSGIPQGAKIKSAKMRVYDYYHNDNGGSGTTNIARITSEWSDDSTSWNNQPSWEGTYLSQNTSPPGVGNWSNWDITTLVQAWIDGTYPNYGVYIVNNNEGSYRMNWAIYNHYYSDPTYATYLEIDYTGDIKYLFKSGSTIYTIIDNTFSALAETEITANLFQTYGINELPDNSLFLELSDIEILYWHNIDDDLSELKITVSGVPPVPQTIITNTQDMSDSTILGIEGIQAVCSDDILFALSFDDEATWKAYNGTSWITLDLPNTGMTKTTMESIGLEAWAEIVTSDYYKVRFILPTTTSYMTSMVVNYIN